MYDNLHANSSFVFIFGVPRFGKRQKRQVEQFCQYCVMFVNRK